jgi:4-carboxymuconolactone decarboxylase
MRRGINSALVVCAALAAPVSCAGESSETSVERNEIMGQKQEQSLNLLQKHIAVIAMYAAAGDMPRLNAALQQGLDSGLTISDCREVLIQLYAYAGFPRSLNALGELMSVINGRREKGIHDAEGNPPRPLPTPDEMLAVGTQNQTSLVGSPVKGALFDFAPAIDQYLKMHLFGDIFARDNLDWRSRELATVGALAGMSGVESQLKAHLNISMNTGLTYSQLTELVPLFEEKGAKSSADRLRVALDSVRAQ